MKYWKFKNNYDLGTCHLQKSTIDSSVLDVIIIEEEVNETTTIKVKKKTSRNSTVVREQQVLSNNKGTYCP